MRITWVMWRLLGIQGWRESKDQKLYRIIHLCGTLAKLAFLSWNMNLKLNQAINRTAGWRIKVDACSNAKIGKKALETFPPFHLWEKCEAHFVMFLQSVWKNDTSRFITGRHVSLSVISMVGDKRGRQWRRAKWCWNDFEKLFKSHKNVNVFENYCAMRCGKELQISGSREEGFSFCDKSFGKSTNDDMACSRVEARISKLAITRCKSYFRILTGCNCITNWEEAMWWSLSERGGKLA